MRTYRTLLLLVSFAGIAACGGGGSGGGTGRDPTTGECAVPGETCTGEDAFMTCISSSCGTEAKACLGNNFAKGDYSGGACSDFMKCQMACPCDSTASTCAAACAQKAGSTCMTCMQTMSTCFQTAGCKEPVCTSSGTGTGTSTSTTTAGPKCNAVIKCCASLAGANASSCDVYGSMGEDACNSALAGMQAQGLCK